MTCPTLTCESPPCPTAGRPNPTLALPEPKVGPHPPHLTVLLGGREHGG